MPLNCVELRWIELSCSNILYSRRSRCHTNIYVRLSTTMPLVCMCLCMSIKYKHSLSPFPIELKLFWCCYCKVFEIGWQCNRPKRDSSSELLLMMMMVVLCCCFCCYCWQLYYHCYRCYVVVLVAMAVYVCCE